MFWKVPMNLPFPDEPGTQLVQILSKSGGIGPQPCRVGQMNGRDHGQRRWHLLLFWFTNLLTCKYLRFLPCLFQEPRSLEGNLSRFGLVCGCWFCSRWCQLISNHLAQLTKVQCTHGLCIAEPKMSLCRGPPEVLHPPMSQVYLPRIDLQQDSGGKTGLILILMW